MTAEPGQGAPPGARSSSAGADGPPAAGDIAATGQDVLVSDIPVSPGRHPGPARGREVRARRPSLGGGIRGRGRELGAQGRLTVRRLLEAGLAEFDERGFQAVRVDDVVRRAKTSHGTFYLSFANKDDLFRTLLQDALHDMQLITGEFPVVTSNEAGRAALRHWIHRFSDIYTAHATVIRILSQADIVGEEVYGDGLRLLFMLSQAVAQGMTAARSHGTASGENPVEHAALTALACLMMLERINYLRSGEA